jgi:NAD(P)-dependent dehydrogenase (short-subunit alcohol dehydrogenase family)
MHVAVLDIDESSIQSAVDELSQRGLSVSGHRVDVADSDSIRTGVDAVEREHGGIDVLCNNAGIALDGLHAVLDIEDAVWDQNFAVNVRGPFMLSKAVLPGMLAKGSGNIINIASVAGLAGRRAGAAYTASKHALVGLTRHIAAAYGTDGIRCNTICPGGVDSGFKAGQTGDEETLKMVQEFRSTMPRRGTPTEVASIAGFLASEESSFINGADIVADAGWTVP